MSFQLPTKCSNKISPKSSNHLAFTITNIHTNLHQFLICSFFSVFAWTDRHTDRRHWKHYQLCSAWLAPHTITAHAVINKKNIWNTNNHQLLATNCNLPCSMLHSGYIQGRLATPECCIYTQATHHATHIPIIKTSERSNPQTHSR